MGDGFAIADKRSSQRSAARSRLRLPGQYGRCCDPYAGGFGLEARVSGVDVGPPGVVGPHDEPSVDADRVEPGGEFGTDRLSHRPVVGDADDADAGSGLGIADEGGADGVPHGVAVACCGGHVDSGGREVGSHRQEHERLFGLEAEQVRDDRDQLVGVVH